MTTETIAHPRRKRRSSKVVRLRDAWDDYRAARDLKEKTVSDYEYLLYKYLRDWLDEPVQNITKDRIEERHRCITNNHGGTTANITMRLMGSLFNFILFRYEVDGQPLMLQNPVKRLSQIRAWNREAPRKRIIKTHELEPWLKAVLALEGIPRDVLLLLILTGLRKSEALLLRWDKLDIKDRTLTIPFTKNHRDHVLPMSDAVFAILMARYECRRAGDTYVFPGRAVGTHVTLNYPFPRAIIAKTGIDFALHDLRRTFVSIGHGLGLSPYILKALANHSDAGEITSRYVCLSVEHLREPMQKITDFIANAAKLQFDLPTYIRETAANRVIRDLASKDKDKSPKPRSRLPIALAKAAIVAAKDDADSRTIAITLSRAWNDFKQIQRISPDAIGDYGRTLQDCLADWACEPLVNLSTERILTRCQEITERSGAFRASITLRVLNLIFEFAKRHYVDGEPLIQANPVQWVLANLDFGAR